MGRLVSLDLAGPQVPASRVGVVTLLNRDKRNCLSSELLAELGDALAEAGDRGLRAVILRAEPGVTTWSAGYAIDELPRDGSDPLTWGSPLETMLQQLRQAPFPVIAAVEGGVWGGACELVLTCDLIVAVRSATFALTPARLGVPYNTGGVAQVLSALPLNVARELFFTADPQSALDWHRFGVVNRLVADSAELDVLSRELALRISERAPLSVRAIRGEISALTAARPLTSGEFERLTDLRRAAWASEDYREGVQAFLDRREPQFEGR